MPDLTAGALRLGGGGGGVPVGGLAELLEGRDLLGRGGSAILGPDGSYLAGPLYDEEGILYAELDPARLLEERQRFDPAGHYHRPDVLRLEVTPTGSASAPLIEPPTTST